MCFHFFIQGIRGQIGSVWPADGTELIDTNLCEEALIFERLKDWSEKSILQRNDAARPVAEGEFQVPIRQSFYRHDALHENYSKGSMELKG